MGKLTQFEVVVLHFIPYCDCFTEFESSKATYWKQALSTIQPSKIKISLTVKTILRENRLYFLIVDTILPISTLVHILTYQATKRHRKQDICKKRQ